MIELATVISLEATYQIFLQRYAHCPTSWMHSREQFLAFILKKPT